MLDKLKRTFSAGGVKVALTPPKVFRPKDPSFPITVVLTNRTKEERTVEDILFELREKTEQNEQQSPSHRPEGVQHCFEDLITLQPGQTHEFTVDMPTTFTGAAETAGIELPGWMHTTGKALSAAQRRPLGYEIRATTRVRGFSVAKTVTRELPSGFGFGFGFG